MKVRWILVAILGAALLPAVATALPPVAGFAPLPNAAMPQDDHDRDHDQDRDHDWDQDPRFQGRGHGYRQGFRAGFEDGRGDRESGQPRHYGPSFRHPMGGYREEFGDRRDYVRDFHDGYQQGYREGYRGRH
jgi:hypothetical protein